MREKLLFFKFQNLWKLFHLLLATHLCEVCVQCMLVLYASVHEVCANIYIYKMQIHQNSNIYLYLNFLLQLGLSLVCGVSLAKLWLLLDPRGDEEALQTFLARQRIGYLHQYQYISQWTHAKSLTVVIPIPQKYSDIECYRLYINSTTIQNTTATTLSLLHYQTNQSWPTSCFLTPMLSSVQQCLSACLHTVLYLSVFGQGYSVTVGRVI